jgi:hypothetical protein
VEGTVPGREVQEEEKRGSECKRRKVSLHRVEGTTPSKEDAAVCIAPMKKKHAGSIYDNVY